MIDDMQAISILAAADDFAGTFDRFSIPCATAMAARCIHLMQTDSSRLSKLADAFETVYREADDDLRSDLYVYFAMSLAQLAAESDAGLDACADRMGQQVRADMLNSREFTSEANQSR